MQYRRNRNTHRKGTVRIISYACIAVLVVTLDWLAGSPLQAYVRSLSTPAIAVVHHATTQKITAYFSSKDALRRENEELKSKLATIEQTNRTLGVLENDSKRFCAIQAPVEIKSGEGVEPIPSVDRKAGASLGVDVRKKTIASGRVIAYERVLFGTLLVEFIDERRPQVGDYVLDDAGNPLGTVEVVFEHDARVKLLTMVSSTHEVKIGKTVVQAHGRMSNTFLLFVPQESEITVGDSVVLSYLQLPLGEVVSFERSPADAQVLVFVRPYARPYETQFVSFIPGPRSNEIHE